MAVLELTPGTLNISLREELAAIVRTPVIKDATGTPVDFSGWFSVLFEIFPSAPSPAAAGGSMGLATGNNDGTVSIAFSTDDTTNRGLGSCGCLVKGKVLTGDDYQTIATGTLTLLAAA